MKTCDHCQAKETDDENELEFITIHTGDESLDLCGSCGDKFTR